MYALIFIFIAMFVFLCIAALIERNDEKKEDRKYKDGAFDEWD